VLASSYFPVMCDLCCLGCSRTVRLSLVVPEFGGAECPCGSTTFIFTVECPPLCMN
jgi:hypothetical protein